MKRPTSIGPGLVLALFALVIAASFSPHPGRVSATSFDDPWSPGERHPLEVPTVELLPPVEDTGPVRADILGTDRRTRVQSSDPLHRKIVWLEIELRRGNARSFAACSGGVIADGVILTAAHCVTGDGDFAVYRVRVVPGKDGKTEPLGSQFAQTWVTPKGWETVDPVSAQRYDIALLFMPDHQLTGKSGVLPGGIREATLGSFLQPGFRATAYGYPSGCDEKTCDDYDEETEALFMWKSRAGYVSANQWYVHGDYQIVPGNSGGVLLDQQGALLAIVTSEPLGLLSTSTRISTSVLAFIRAECDRFAGCDNKIVPAAPPRILPGLAFDEPAAPVDPAGQACAAEYAYLDGVVNGTYDFLDKYYALLVLALDSPDAPTSSKFKNKFATLKTSAVNSARSLQRLKPPNDGYTPFDMQLDAGMGLFVVEIDAFEKAVTGGKLKDIEEWLDASDDTEEAFEDIGLKYPGFTAACAR